MTNNFERQIIYHLTPVHIPQNNDVAKRFNRSMLEKLRSMLNQSGLPYEFWAQVVNTIVYFVNLYLLSANNFLKRFKLGHTQMIDHNRLKILVV